MGYKAKRESSVLKDAVVTALGSLVFCGALYLLNLAIPILSTLNINLRDLQMIAICTVLFAFFWPLLGKVLIEPYVALMEAREQRTTGADAYCDEREAEAQRITDQYEGRLFEARSAAMREKLQRIAAAKEEAAKIVEQAQQDAQKELQQVRAKISSRTAQLEAEVSREVESVAKSVVDQILTPTGKVA